MHLVEARNLVSLLYAASSTKQWVSPFLLQLCSQWHQLKFVILSLGVQKASNQVCDCIFVTYDRSCASPSAYLAALLDLL